MREKDNKEEGMLEENDDIIEWESAVSRGGKDKSAAVRLKKGLLSAGIILSFLVSVYLTIVYSNNPFIEKWRTIYIETAMTTNSHQWLATLFFPQSVIDEVMARRQKNLDAQADVNSTWEEEEKKEESQESKDFYKKYWELDTDSVRAYLEKEKNPDKQGFDSIQIEDFEERLKLKTVNGDSLLVLDTANNLMILGVKGDGYVGKLAIVKAADQVELVKSKSLGSFGQEAGSFGKDLDALLVINASGFTDVDGVGTGGEVKGSLIVDGVEYGYHASDYGWKFCGMKKDNRMYISDYPYNTVSDYRWGVEFLPALVVNGESVVDGTFGMGIQPRASIGQTRDGDFLMLIIDGRQVGYSLGCTVEDCKNILMDYKAYQAMNLDGGSSAVMWYNGDYITKSSSVTGIGRYMPDALIIKKAKQVND